MSIDRFQSIRMTKHHVIAISATFESLDTNLTVKSGTDRIALQHLQIYSFMHTTTTGTIFRGDPCHRINGDRIDKGGTVYRKRIRKIDLRSSPKRINPTVLPIGPVQFISGKHQVLLFFHFDLTEGRKFLQFHILPDINTVCHQFGNTLIHLFNMNDLLRSSFIFFYLSFNS